MKRESIRHCVIQTPTVDLIQLVVNFMLAGEFCWKTNAHNNIDMSGKERNDKEFLTTRWSEVEQAGNAKNTEGFQARDNVVKRYYPALVAHLVSVKRIPVQRAEDYLQSFVERKILEKDLLSSADRKKGLFRTYLMSCLDRFVIDEIRREEASIRKPKSEVPIEDFEDRIEGDRYVHSPDIMWARQVLDETIREMQANCRTAGREDVWGIFKQQLLDPILEGTPKPPYEELIKRFNLKSPTQAYNLLATGKRMYLRCLRRVVAEYAGDDHDIDCELADLYSIVSRAS